MPDEQQPSSGYAFGQLERALRMAAGHDDPAVRERALAKAERWRAVIGGMAGGELTVGSRTPVAGTPAWVTLEVAHGGFATGRLLAELPLSDDETARVAGLPAEAPGTTDRDRLNLWYLGDAGQAELLDALASERYRIELPEDAALPTVAWLLRNGRHEAALDLVAELRPWMHRLRLTPALTASALPAAGTSVHLEPVGPVRDGLRVRAVPAQVAAMRETLGVWHPLYDRLVELWAGTVEGELPELGADGTVRGGWPCRRWPSDWEPRREQWLADAAAAREHGDTTPHPKSNLARLHAALERCPPTARRSPAARSAGSGARWPTPSRHAARPGRRGGPRCVPSRPRSPTGRRTPPSRGCWPTGWSRTRPTPGCPPSRPSRPGNRCRESWSRSWNGPGPRPSTASSSTVSSAPARCWPRCCRG